MNLTDKQNEAIKARCDADFKSLELAILSNGHKSKEVRFHYHRLAQSYIATIYNPYFDGAEMKEKYLKAAQQAYLISVDISTGQNNEYDDRIYLYTLCRALFCCRKYDEFIIYEKRYIEVCMLNEEITFCEIANSYGYLARVYRKLGDVKKAEEASVTCQLYFGKDFLNGNP
jgi:hypothetical protein